MLTIYKYAVMGKDYFSFDMPRGAKILTVQLQYGEPRMWALVNPKNPKETRNFLIAVTGGEIKEKKENLNYIGTFQQAEGRFVGHLFEIKK